MKKQKNKLKKWQIFLIVIAVIVVIGAFAGGGKDSHIYDRAKDVDAHTGMGDVNGKISLIEVSSEECTDEALVDWYTNYVEEKADDYNYFIIKYTDKDDEGVWALGVGDLIVKGVKLEEEERYKNEYYVVDSSDAINYIVKDGKLEELK